MITPHLPGPRTGLSRRQLLAGVTTIGATGLVLGASGCGVKTDPLAASSPGTSRSGDAVPTPTAEIVVGAGSFTESAVLAELFSQALVAKGIASSTRSDLGSREDYLSALDDDAVALLPVYTGALLLHLDPTASALTAEDIETALKPLVTDRGLALLKTSTAVDQDVYCLTAKLSSETGITSLADLKTIAPTAVLGGPASLQKRSYGPPGLAEIYQARFKQFRPYTSDATLSADLLANRIQVATFFTTQSLIADHGLVQLADPEGMILPQNVVPIARPAVADDPQAAAAVNAVQAALTTEDLTSLGRQVDVDKTPARRAAAAYLRSKRLV